VCVCADWRLLLRVITMDSGETEKRKEKALFYLGPPFACRRNERNLLTHLKKSQFALLVLVSFYVSSMGGVM
jgi:hypothetical protein